VRLRKDFVLNYLLRADVAERMRDELAAEHDYRTALNYPLNADAQYMLYIKRGYLRLRRGRPADAVVDFQAAQRRQPDRYAAYLGLAQAYFAQGRLDEAGQRLKDTLDRRPEDWQQARAYGERLAGYFFETGQYRAAVDACDAALRTGGPQTGKRPRRLALLRWKAVSLLKLGRYPEAAAAFDRYAAVERTPGADFYRLRGEARVALGAFLGAVNDYGEALHQEAEPDAALFTHRGWAYSLLESWKPALGDFEAALRLDRNQTDAYVGRGLARVMQGDYRAGVADAEEALRRGPTTPEMMHNVACTLALASARADHDAAADGKRLAADWRTRAVEVVGKALGMVPAAERRRFWREQVWPDRALDPLRSEAAFKELGRRL
jgi:tetratricopeptide (TPR) repeat protein